MTTTTKRKHTAETILKMSEAKRGEKHPQAKLTWADVKAIRAGIKLGQLQKVLAKEFGVTQQEISVIKLNKAWPVEQEPKNA